MLYICLFLLRFSSPLYHYFLIGYIESNVASVAFSIHAQRNPAYDRDLNATYREYRIRTCDPLFPKQMRYQAALIPVEPLFRIELKSAAYKTAASP